METKRRPTAALINGEWYKSASSVLNRDDLADVVLGAIGYVLDGELPAGLSSTAQVVFAMVRPALDSDISKFNERCLRNAENAKAKRVATSGNEWQRVATSGEQQQPQPQPQQQQQPLSLSKQEELEIERDKFRVWGYFWSIGSADVKGECNAFWSYYEALGWKNNKGAKIVSRLAAARMWRRQFESRAPKEGAAAWFQAFKDCPILDYTVFNAYMGAQIHAEELVTVEVRFRANEPYLRDVEVKVPQCIEMFRRLVRADKVVLNPDI